MQLNQQKCLLYGTVYFHSDAVHFDLKKYKMMYVNSLKKVMLMMQKQARLNVLYLSCYILCILYNRIEKWKHCEAIVIIKNLLDIYQIIF